MRLNVKSIKNKHFGDKYISGEIYDKYISGEEKKLGHQKPQQW